MAARIPAGLKRAQWSGAEGRRFGFTVGAAFLLIALVLWWRGGPVAALVTGSIGSSLVVAGLLAPVSLEPVHRWWMALALLISKVTTPILMGVVYLLVITPIGLVMRLGGRNPIAHRATADGGYWKRRDAATDARGGLEHQF